MRLQNSRIRLLLGACLGLLLSLSLALVGASWIGDSPVDVAVDLVGELPQPPWLRAGERKVPMQAVPHTTGEGPNSFRVTATGHKNPEAQGTEVWLVGAASLPNLQQSPGDSWTVREQNLISPAGRQPASLSWEGDGSLELRFVSHAWSGIAQVTTPAGTQEIDLYSAQGGARLIAVHPPKVSRFHARLSRRELSGLILDLGGLDPGRLYRLYVGTFLPTVFRTAPVAPTKPEWGRVVLGWRPRAENGQLRLGTLSTFDHGGGATVLALFGLLALSLAILSAGVVGGRRLLRSFRAGPPGGRSLAPLSPRLWLLLALPLLAVLLFWWFSFYPGLVSIDSAIQWQQIQERELNDHHPAFHTLLLMLITSVWDTPAAAILFQILLLTGVVSYGFLLLLRAGVPRMLVAGLYVLLMVSPQFGHMGIALVKDTPYTAVLFGVTLLLAQRLLGAPPRWERGFWILTGVLLAVATLLRHNGILVTVGMSLLLPLFFWERRRTAVLAALAAVLTLLMVRAGVYGLLDVDGRKFTHRATTFAWHLGALVREDVPLAPDEHAFLEELRHFDEKRWLYSPASVATIIWGDPKELLDFAYADANLTRLTDLHNSLLVRYPLLFVRHFLRANAYLYWPLRMGRSSEIVDLTFFLGESSTPQTWMRLIGHPMEPLLPEAKATLSGWLEPSLRRDEEAGWLLWRPAVYMYLGILGVVVAAWRCRDWRLLILLGPMLMNTASLAFGVAQEVRFQFPVFISWAFFLALAALPRRAQSGTAQYPVVAPTPVPDLQQQAG